MSDCGERLRCSLRSFCQPFTGTKQKLAIRLAVIEIFKLRGEIANAFTNRDNVSMSAPDTNKTEISEQYIEESFAEMMRIIRKVGPYITEHAGKSKNVELKPDDSPVTPEDVEVEKIISTHMQETFPLIPVLGEESGYDEYNLPEVCWLVDPIDGTKYYISGDPQFTTMATLVERGQAIAAIIYDPTQDTMYAARKGKGAYKNNERIDLDAVPLPATLYCKQTFATRITDALKKEGIPVDAVNTEGGGGYGFIQVLDGAVAARVTMLGRGYLHDYAPAGLLVQEAGGVIVPIIDDVYTINTRSFVACHPGLKSFFEAMQYELRAAELAEKTTRVS